MKLALGRALYDPGDPMGKLFFNILATFAEFEADLIRMRTRKGIAIARAKGKLRGKQPKLSDRKGAGTLPHACHGRVFHQRSRRALLSLKTNRLPHTQPAPFPLAYDPAPYRNRPEIRHFRSPIPDSFSPGVSGITMPFPPPLHKAQVSAIPPVIVVDSQAKTRPGVYVGSTQDRLCEPQCRRSTALSGVRVFAQDYLGAGIVPTPQPR